MLRGGHAHLAGRHAHSFYEVRHPEAIQQSFPALRLAQVYGAIAYYLDHQHEIRHYLEDAMRRFISERSRSSINLPGRRSSPPADTGVPSRAADSTIDCGAPGCVLLLNHELHGGERRELGRRADIVADQFAAGIASERS